MIWTILGWIAVGLTILTGVIALMGLFIWATWFKFPRVAKTVSKVSFHVSIFGRNVAEGTAGVASAPFLSASRRLERLKNWAKKHYKLSKIRVEQLNSS